ncbi:MAG: AAA family ATPase [Betaproteobacteria bacterium]|nr:AAA family ATPase [Betaproteobacteria bacterium]
MEQELPPLIRALLEPRRYPHLPDAVERVELVQTHISWVLLAGDFAYKIKKPLKLPFLDFSTLERRHDRCEDELRLNSRFAPDIYLDVVSITHTVQDPRISGPGTPIEYAVRMRRFDEAGRLDRVCARGELTAAHLSDLADAVVSFHAGASIMPPASRFGMPTEVLAPALDNFHDLSRLLRHGHVQARLNALRAWTEAQFKHLSPLMEARKRAGRVRECHGDLHLANLVMIGGRVRMFDCLEFNEDLRCIDVASEIAFTYIDLLDHGQPGLANWFVDEVFSRNGDYEAVHVLRFYAVYRALVRAKVEAIRTGQTQDDSGEAMTSMTYIALAEQLVRPPPVRLIITHGLAGCGKTADSSRLLQSDLHACTLRLRSDVERKRLFGLVGTHKSGSGMDSGIYSPDAHARTYAHLRDRAGMLLRAGWSVIVDAAFLKRADRDSFHALAGELGAAFGILAPQATPALLRERIHARRDLGRDASEATIEVLEQQMRRVELLDAEERNHLLAG